MNNVTRYKLKFGFLGFVGFYFLFVFNLVLVDAAGDYPMLALLVPVAVWALVAHIVRHVRSEQ